MSSLRTWVLGIDASLTRTALVLIPPRWILGDWVTLTVREVEVPAMPISECRVAGDPMGADYRFEEYRIDRLDQIAKQAVQWASDQVGVGELRGFTEDYAFSARSASVTKLAELGGSLRVAFYHRGVVLTPVPSTSWRKLLLGKLPRGGHKEAAHAALYRAGFLRERCRAGLSPERRASRWVKDCGDAADAFGVANAGLAAIGLPFMTLA